MSEFYYGKPTCRSKKKTSIICQSFIMASLPVGVKRKLLSYVRVLLWQAYLYEKKKTSIICQNLIMASLPVGEKENFYHMSESYYD